GTVGKVARLGVPAAFNQSCYAFVPDSISPALLYLTVRQAGTELTSLVHGSVFDTITTRTFDQVQIPDVRMAPDAATGRLTRLHVQACAARLGAAPRPGRRSPLLGRTGWQAWERTRRGARGGARQPTLWSGDLGVEDVAESAGLGLGSYHFASAR